MEDKIFRSPIANPMADGKLTKTIIKLTAKSKIVKLRESPRISTSSGGESRKSPRESTTISEGNPNTTTSSLCIMTGDISPIDVLAHLPTLCEEKDVPYIFIPSREDLGIACKTKRPTSTVLLVPEKTHPKYRRYLKLMERIKGMNPYFQ